MHHISPIPLAKIREMNQVYPKGIQAQSIWMVGWRLKGQKIFKYLINKGGFLISVRLVDRPDRSSEFSAARSTPLL